MTPMTAKKPIQLMRSRVHTSSGSVTCFCIIERTRFFLKATAATASTHAKSQYSTVGFHFMNVSSWKSSVAPPNAVAKHLWVALKHEITFLKPTFLQDKVVAEVIAEKVEGARAFFHTLIKRGEDVLAEVRSSWCCLDADTQRPARLAREVIGMFVGEKKAE